MLKQLESVQNVCFGYNIKFILNNVACIYGDRWTRQLQEVLQKV